MPVWITEKLTTEAANVEAGYYSGYGNRLTGIVSQAQTAKQTRTLSPEQFEAIGRSYEYLEAVFDEIDTSKIPRAPETRHYFKAKTLFDDSFRKAYESFAKQYEAGKDSALIYLDRLKELSGMLLAIGRSGQEITQKILDSLRQISGYEDYQIGRKIPKKFQTLENLASASAAAPI